ncbi:hypothetical protein [Paenibacillus sp. 1001270B_150601_E10]|uniref:hypothetical protein n=1 Tax=Paenibacillus sp. 1001270B_150601_E10 TaxID=2787079 RepID=UPI0018A0723D|nr:hypothetical protein [Paenibacillus sp. 1001270B_150601_E10]
MNNTKLIMFEGIPGSGKTTTSKLLYNYLNEVGVNTKIYVEGSEHPIDLPFYAYLTKNDYNALLKKFPQLEEWIQLKSIIEDDYVLLPYKVPEPKPWNEELIEYLSSKEFCYSDKAIVPFNIYKKVFYTRFKQYVTRMFNTDTVTIFESVLFQHQIHDINRLYPQIKEDEIIEYIRNLAIIISPLNPILFYISQNSVEESLKHTAIVRSKPKWSNPKTIEYYIRRKNIELRAVKSLPFGSYIMNNTDRNWNKMFDDIKNILSIASSRMS